MLAEHEQKRWIVFAGDRMLMNMGTWCLFFWSRRPHLHHCCVEESAAQVISEKPDLVRFNGWSRNFELFPLCFT